MEHVDVREPKPSAVGDASTSRPIAFIAAHVEMLARPAKSARAANAFHPARSIGRIALVPAWI
jgi:hypothetical protein